jgi:glucuronoarabinoxylan endo-1,4-beta-xylanase
MDLTKIFRNSSSVIKLLAVFVFLSVFSNCGGDEGGDVIDDPIEDSSIKVSVDPAVTYQEMTGFGGALTWYCDRITNSSKKEEITDLMFEDLGLDIVRLKNWYYPSNYPTDKTTDQMEVSWFKQHFDATNELFDIAKQKNPDIKVLLSSWGPPSSLKDNGELNEGTLRKDNGVFMYDEFAIYMEDVLNALAFTPDYLSIQNEPSYTNPGWETCEWRATETLDFPGYATAFDKVHDLIKNRTTPPMLIGPESANLGNASNFAGNTFKVFADALKDKDYLGMYAYHPYNLNESSSLSDMESSLHNLDNYRNKPNIMTEYSSMSWLKTAQFINRTLNIANASGYIYWELMWAEDSEHAMIKVNSAGNYELTPYYYLIKQYSKHISEGYLRVDLSTGSATIDAVAFIDPSGDKLVAILINPSSTTLEIKFDVAGHTPSGVMGWQSTESNNYKEMADLAPDKEISLVSGSVTTIVLDI